LVRICPAIVHVFVGAVGVVGAVGADGVFDAAGVEFLPLQAAEADRHRRTHAARTDNDMGNSGEKSIVADTAEVLKLYGSSSLR
jgi:hypothetical protein